MKKLFSTLLGIVCILQMACTQNHLIEATPISNDVVVSHGLYKKHFHDLKSMTQDSKVIILGKVTENLQTRFIKDEIPQFEIDRMKARGEIPGVLFTDYKIKVDKTIKGSIKSNEEIIVVQTGGVYEGKTNYMEGEPLFVVGETILLFLADISGDTVHASSTSKYVLNGSPQARFNIASEKVKSVVKKDELQSKYHDKNIAEFIREIQQNVE